MKKQTLILAGMMFLATIALKAQTPAEKTLLTDTTRNYNGTISIERINNKVFTATTLNSYNGIGTLYPALIINDTGLTLPIAPIVYSTMAPAFHDALLAVTSTNVFIVYPGIIGGVQKNICVVKANFNGVVFKADTFGLATANEYPTSV